MAKKYAELDGLPESEQFINGDLQELENMSWRRAAHHIWYDAVIQNEPKHAVKWAGMFSARALHSIEEDSRRLKKLTRWLISLTFVLCVLTAILSWDVCSKWVSGDRNVQDSSSNAATQKAP